MKRTKPAAAILACAVLAASVPVVFHHAAAQKAPAAGGKKPPPKKKKGDKPAPPDSASASVNEPAPPPPPVPEPASSSAAPPPPPPASSSAAPALPPAPASEAGSWKKPAGIIALGSGVVLLGGTYLFYKLNVNQNDAGYHAYARGFPPSQNTCDAAKAGLPSPFLGAKSPQDVAKICSRGKTYTVLEVTTLGLGVVAIGLGVYWLVTSGPPKTETAWTLAPRLGETTGLDLAVRF